MATDPPTLDHRNAPAEIGQPLSPWLALFYSPWLALFLCAPGAACFAMYFCNIGNFHALIGMLLAAVMTALTSLVIYGRYARRALPWYVALNLAINLTGLLFAAVALVAYT